MYNDLENSTCDPGYTVGINMFEKIHQNTKRMIFLVNYVDYK